MKVDRILLGTAPSIMEKQLVCLCFLISFIILTSCQSEKAETQEEKLFSLANNSGIEFVNQLNPTTELNILTYLYYYNGGGVATGDLNNDGLIDLYFTGNQVNDHLYINQGGLRFEEVGKTAGIQNADGWTTGVSMVDINADGLLDIYICKVGAYGSINGTNLLLINQGPNEAGIPVFKEQAVAFGLDIKSFSTQSAFFDMDLDGDLDMFLLNHSVNPNRTYGKGSTRADQDSLAGDRLYRNDNGKFINVSKEVGIFQGVIGYGLGVGISDINNDGFPDIYVGNDFFENDYLYINNGDGSFEELMNSDPSRLGHTTHFSMGNDLADINNDGAIDILSVDMLPSDLIAYKTSGHEYNNQIYDQYLKNGYHPQYMQNTFHLNQSNGYFREIGYMSGLSATDWSWAPLCADLDNDGNNDVFITNGILGATNDMDFINFIANDKIQQQIEKGMGLEELKFTKEIPERKLPNYFFKNKGDLSFEDVTDQWFERLPSFSNGAAYADLDNDGDLDLVVNNVNESAFLLENRSEQLNENHRLTIKTLGNKKNTNAIGSKIWVYTGASVKVVENFISRGYLSSVSSDFHVGIGSAEIIDSLIIRWPEGSVNRFKKVRADSTLVLDQNLLAASASEWPLNSQRSRNFEHSKLNLLSAPWKHQEKTSYEFGREPLIPYANGEEGPRAAVGDLNADGLEDFYLCGGKKQAGALYLQQTDGTFDLAINPAFEENSDSEEIDAHFFDADNDGDLDLITVSGGNEVKNGKRIAPILYKNANGIIKRDLNFPLIEVNASRVVSSDLDNDGDLDLIITSNAKPRYFGASSKQYILQNNGQGGFKDITYDFGGEFQNIGLIDDIDINDFNRDGLPDLVVAGKWLPITIFINTGNSLELQKDNGLQASNGLWSSVKTLDIDSDGDLDIVAGNWGLNTRLRASKDYPLNLYSKDFDQNGTIDPIVTYFQDKVETVFVSKDDLMKQLPDLNKKFLSYQAFANAELHDLFAATDLSSALKKRVYTLEHSVFINNGQLSFSSSSFPFLTQSASVKDLHIDDFNNDGSPDLYVVGNDHAVNTQLGRIDASHGTLLINNGQGSFYPAQKQLTPVSGLSRNVQKLTIKGKDHLLITRNNDTPVILNTSNYENQDE